MKNKVNLFRAGISAFVAGVLSTRWCWAAEEGLGQVGNNETMTLVLAIIKVVGSLAVVVLLLIVAVSLVKKMGLGRGGMQAGGLINVLDTRMIGPKKYVTIVEIAGDCVALGVTDQQINVLTTISSLQKEDRQPVKHFGPMLGKASTMFAAGKGKKEKDAK